MCFYRLGISSWLYQRAKILQCLVMDRHWWCAGWVSEKEGCHECSEYEGLYWHASWPSQTITKSRLHGVNIRTSQVTHLSFCSSVSFTKFSLEEFLHPVVSSLSGLYYTSFLWLPSEGIQTSCVHGLLCHLAVWKGMMCLILIWPSFLSSGSFCLLVAPLASPLGCREEWKAASPLVPLYLFGWPEEQFFPSSLIFVGLCST